MTGRDITPEDLAPGTPRSDAPFLAPGTTGSDARLDQAMKRPAPFAKPTLARIDLLQQDFDLLGNESLDHGERLDSQCGRLAALETNRLAHYNRAANAERRLAELERRTASVPGDLKAIAAVLALIAVALVVLGTRVAYGAEVWTPNGAGAEFCALAAPFDTTGLEACVATDSGPEACFPMIAGGAPPCVIPPEFGIWAAVVVPVSTEETRQLLVANPIGVRARWHARDGSYTEWAPRLVLTGEDSPGILYVTLRRQAEAAP